MEIILHLNNSSHIRSFRKYPTSSMPQMLPMDKRRIFYCKIFLNFLVFLIAHLIKSLSKNLPLLLTLKKSGGRQYQNGSLCRIQFEKYHPHIVDPSQIQLHLVPLYLINRQQLNLLDPHQLWLLFCSWRVIIWAKLQNKVGIAIINQQ